MFRKLTSVVRQTEQFQLAHAEDKLVCIPTGHGMALVFRNSPEAHVQCALGAARAELHRAETSDPLNPWPFSFEAHSPLVAETNGGR